LVADNLIPFAEASEQIWNVGAEIFVPAASSRLVKQAEVDKMIAAGLEVIACGANVPFADKEIFFGSIMEHTDNHVAVIPDFIANCGMARVFAYLMQRNVEMSDDAIFSDASNIIHNALLRQVISCCSSNITPALDNCFFTCNFSTPNVIIMSN
ncbi:MAG: hypothetical protein EOO42_23335, partial [Flavobacteriales bacterium]